MPRLSVWFVRSALVYLALGFTFGALMLFEKGVPVYPALLRLLPAHIEFLLFGWTVQLAMGIAFWILPRFGGGASSSQRPSPSAPVNAAPRGAQAEGTVDGTRARQAGGLSPRGNEKAAWLAFGLLNAGIWLAGMGAVLDLAPAVLLLGRVVEAAAAVAFVVHAWPRIKPLGR